MPKIRTIISSDRKVPTEEHEDCFYVLMGGRKELSYFEDSKRVELTYPVAGPFNLNDPRFSKPL